MTPGVELDMPADRDLDALCALAMGWQWWQALGAECRWLGPPDGGLIQPPRAAPEDWPLCTDWHREIPAYSRLWADAGLILDWLDLDAQPDLSRRASGQWRCAIGSTVAYAATGPHAVAIAFARAVQGGSP